MIRRLLALLLLLALATPAVAMSGHCEPLPVATTMKAMHGGEHQHSPAPTERRDCVGCVLPMVGNAVSLEAAMPAGIVGSRLLADTLAPVAGGPETPPPRA